MRATLRRFPRLRPAARRHLGGAWMAALTLVLAEALGGAAIAAPCDRCNVVLVTFDALRADRLGIYGSRKPTSPVLDAFARRSAVFEDCISQSATTVSAVPAILAGRYPVTDALLEGLTLRPDVDTLATALHRAGYRTLAVIGHTFAGCKYSGCRDLDVVSDARQADEPTGKTVARVLALLEAEAREPFFLWVHLRVPHAPYDASPAQFAAMYDDPAGPTVLSAAKPGESFFDTLERLRAYYSNAGEPVSKTRFMTGRKVETTPTVIAQLTSLYDANVRIGDAGFGRLLAYLKRRQLLPRTIVVVGADHGEALGEHGIFGHNNLWHGMLHVPLVVHVPGTRGRRIDAPVMNVDIAPTVARLVGAPLAQPVRGRDLLEPIENDRVRMAEYDDHYVVVRHRLKLHVRMWPQGGADRTPVPDGLWDLSTDPAETLDLSAERPALADELKGLGEALRKSRLAAEPTRRPDDIFDRLRALGYVEGDPSGER